MIKVSTECYIQHNGKTLMLYRNKKHNDMHEGRWVGIGGKVEQGESPEECIAREAFEESGLNIKNPSLRGILSFPNFHKRGDDWLVFLFVVSEFSGELLDSNEGELTWIEDTQLHTLPMHEGDYLFMHWMNEYKLFTAKFVYDENNLISHELIVYLK